MQKVLKKRIGRELRANLLRYLALGFMIMLGMYIVVSLVGAADTVIVGGRRNGEELFLEDGEFTVFVPLTKSEEEALTDSGITLEAMFYMDFTEDDGSTLRVFQTRETLNRIALDEGRTAQDAHEIVLEKRYCEEHEIKSGDEIYIGGQQFTVTGIGSVPDYDAPYRNLSDSSVDSAQFGIAFVTKEMYEILAASGNSGKSEEYVYAYRLNGKMTAKELKKELQKLKVSPEHVEDAYFQEYWERTAGKKEELTDGLEELADGSSELTDGLGELDGYSGELKDGADEILSMYLSEAEASLEDYGLTKELTEENFEEALKELEDASESAIFRMTVRNLRLEMKALKEYSEGTAEYTGSVGDAAEGAEELHEGIQELKNRMEELLDTYFDTDLDNLTLFLSAEDNPRIGAAADDQVINKLAGLIAGVIVMILFTYVISVFVIQSIEQESAVIGALYALGVKRKDLLIHYLTLPVVITFVCGAAGTLLGYSKWGVNVQIADCYAYFSVPKLDTVYSPYLLVYGLLMPPAAAILVNCIVIRKRLARPALALLRGEQKAGKIRNLRLGKMGFIGRFRIRQMLREARSGATVIFGMFISLLIMMIGINCYVLCEHISVENKADTKFEYMYTYKYPEASVPDGGEACYAKTLKREIFGYNLDVTLMGIDKENPYFAAEVSDSKNEVVISSAMAQKYGLAEGDKVILTDEEAEMDYAFTVSGITQYSVGMYAFMEIGAMREFFGEEEDYYNVVLSDRALDIPSGRLYAVISREEISKSSDVFTELMMPMIYMMIGVSAVIFCIVMYLMMKMMIDRSAFGISLIKVFGYRPKEVRRLYLNGNFYIIALGAAVCLPLAKKIMDAMYPMLISNVACGMNLAFSWQLYLGIYAGILLLYFVIDRMLIRRLNRILPAEVLKNRE